MRRLVIPIAAAATVFAPAQPLTAQTASRDATIIVTAPIDRSRLETLQGVSTLSGAELRARLEPTLGETLAREPGVSSTFFGPGASRPLIRGQGGERIRVLNDGIGNFDVSTTSVDHVVAADPLSAERIEIVRGPAALLYGDAASGGVVNVIEGRIPRAMVRGIEAEVLGFYGSNAGAVSGAAELDWGIGDRVTAHADVFHRQQHNYRDGRGRRIGNSALRSTGAAVGASWFGAGGFVGANLSGFDSRYEIPGDVVFIDARQYRGDFSSELPVSAIGTIRARAGYADYVHKEIDDTGVVATTFANREFEGRVDLRHRAIGRLQGAIGVQYRDRQFEAVGFEAFVPPSTFNQLGLFLFERAELGRFAVEGGLRHSWTRLRTEGFADPAQFVSAARLSFGTVSGSLGIGFRPVPGALIGASLYRTARAPALEELFANGPHAATGTYELGDPALRPETARGFELTARYAPSDALTLEANVFYSTYRGYIVERETGELRLDLPVHRFEATDARFWGAEAVGRARLAEGSWGVLDVDILADFVRARDTLRGEPLPRIPPLRVIGGVEARRNGQASLRAELVRANAQRRVSLFERATPGYTLLNLTATIEPVKGLELQLRAANLTNVFARTHTSFLRDRAPLAGRDIRLLARMRF